MHDKPTYKPRLLKTVVIDLVELASFVEFDLEHLLNVPVKGIYSSVRNTLLIEGRKCSAYTSNPSYYYHDNANQMFVPVDHEIVDIRDIRAPVYNSEFNLLISSAQLRDRHEVLNNGPVAPVVGMQALTIYVETYIDKLCRWKRVKTDPWFAVLPLLKNTWKDPEHQVSAMEREQYGETAYNIHDETLRRLKDAAAPLIRLLNRDIPEKILEWAIVQVSRRDTKLHVRLYEDYRIAQWMDEHDQGRNLESLAKPLDRDHEPMFEFWRNKDDD